MHLLEWLKFKRLMIPSVGESAEGPEHVPCPWECPWDSHFGKTVGQFPKKLNILLTYNPATIPIHLLR